MCGRDVHCGDIVCGARVVREECVVRGLSAEAEPLTFSPPLGRPSLARAELEASASKWPVTGGYWCELGRTGNVPVNWLNLECDC